MADMNMGMETENIKNGYIVDRIITSGLNLLVVPNEEEGFCFAFSIAICVAYGTKLGDRETRQGNVLYFALKDGTGERTRQKIADIARSDENLGKVTVIYKYEPGSFGDRIEEGLDVFLHDNPQITMIVIDSLEKIVESETGRVQYDSAYRKLCAIKNVADKHDVAILVETHTRVPGSRKLADVADIVLDVNNGENQNKREYTICVVGNDIHETEITIEFDADRCRWNQVTVK